EERHDRPPLLEGLFGGPRARPGAPLAEDLRIRERDQLDARQAEAGAEPALGDVNQAAVGAFRRSGRVPAQRVRAFRRFGLGASSMHGFRRVVLNARTPPTTWVPG